MASGAEEMPSDRPTDGSEALKLKLTENVQLGLRLRDRYMGAAVLTLYWEAASHEGYKKEAMGVVELFHAKFRYHAEAYPIPSYKSQLALTRKIMGFIETHDGDEKLLIIHYGGHGDENADRATDDERRSVWAAHKSGGPTVSWFDIQQILNYTDSDTLLLLDCCHSSQSARDTIRFELLAGCAMKRETLSPGPYSFTTALIREIEELLHRWGKVEVSELHKRLINRRARLSETPIYVPLSRKGARDGIWLIPIEPDTVSKGLANVEAGMYSLQLNITAAETMDNDTAPFRKLTNWIRRGLPEEVLDIKIEKVILRAEKLHDIVHLQDQTMNGQPILQILDGATQFDIRKLWRPMKWIFMEVESLWAANGIFHVLPSVNAFNQRLAGLIRRIDAQNEAVTNAVGQGTSTKELDESMLRQLEHNETVELSGLAETFRLQRLVRFADKTSTSLQIEADRVRPVTPDASNSTWQLGTTDQLVIVESKSYNQYDHAEESERAQTRIQNLANLLAVEKSKPFHSLACLHWFHDDYHCFFGLVFGIPDVYKPSATPLKVLVKRDIKVSLEQRFKMAMCLCQALQKWHSVNWLHKGIKSDSIFVFQRKDTGDWDFGNPFLSGHEYARPDSGITSARFIENFTENVYRHPNRQGAPVVSHERIHDMYSLGVVLLELGLWQPIEHFPEFRSVVLVEGRGKGNARLTPQEMRDHLLSNAKNRLGHYMGSDYQIAVTKCLSTEPELAKNFETGVYDSIAKGIAVS